MNQILSVELPKNNRKSTNKHGYSGKKASTKSVVTFFAVLLLILGIAMIGIGVYSHFSNNSSSGNGGTENNTKPRIDISQNAGDLDVEIFAENEISKVEYSWNSGEMQEKEGEGKSTLELSIRVPSGTNTLYIKAIDVNGNETSYTNSYVGPEMPEAKLDFNGEENKLKIVCEGQEIISRLKYYYDEEQEQMVEVNSTTAEVEIPIKQGAHDLTIIEEYENGTIKQASNKVYFPIVERVKITSDRKSFLVNASDERKIKKVVINFNGVVTEEEVNSETFEKTLELKDGENKLILTVYNTDDLSITTRTRWVKE